MSDDGDVARLLRRIRELGRQRQPGRPGRWPWDEKPDKPGRAWDEVLRKPKTWDEGHEDSH
jgi:hypothetical protein